MERERVQGGRRGTRWAVLFVAVLATASGATGQAPDTAVYAAAPGTYRMAEGGLAVVFDLVDRMPDGRHQLVWLEASTGRVRTLYPAEDGFAAGPGWFRREPETFRVRFQVAEGVASSVERVEAGDTVRGRRLVFPERELRVEGPAGVLAATLILPPGVGRPPYGAALLVSGSGPVTRRQPRFMAEQIAAAGVAALVYDKRGTGDSEGSFAGTRLEEFGEDVAALLDALRARPEVEAERVGVMASSEGGLVLPLALELAGPVAFVVCRVCPAMDWGEALPAGARAQLAAAGVQEAQIEEAVTLLEAQARYARTRKRYGALAEMFEATAGRPWRERLELRGELAPAGAASWDWYAAFLEPDPEAMYRRLRAPVLLLFGEEDLRVPPAIHVPRARAALEAAGNEDVTVYVVEHGTHGLMIAEEDEEGARILRRYPADLHGRIVGWIAEHAGGPG